MAMLSEGLEWILKANTSGLKKGIDEGKTAVKGLEDQTKKSNDSMAKSFDKTKQSIEKARGVTLFYAAAIAALATPALKADAALRKLSASSILLGNGPLGQSGISAVKRTADALGVTYASAAESAAKASTQFGIKSESALKLVEHGTRAAKLGFEGTETVVNALAGAAKRFGQDAGSFAEMFGSKFVVGARQAGVETATFVNALSSVARPATEAGVSMDGLISTVASLTQGGLLLDESVSLVSSTIKAAIRPTEEQNAAWASLGLTASKTLVAGDALAGTMQFMQRSATTNEAAVSTLTNATDELASAFSSVDISSMVNVMNQVAAASGLASQAMFEQKSSLDKISELLAKMQNQLTPISDLAIGISDAFKLVGATVQQSVSLIDSLLGKAAGVLGGFGFEMGQQIFGTPNLPGFAAGGFVPGYGIGDKVPALLEPGEFVVKRSVASTHAALLDAMNSGASAMKISQLRAMYEAAQRMQPFGTFSYMQSSNPVVRALGPFGRFRGETSPLLNSSSPKLGSSSPLLGSSSAKLLPSAPMMSGFGFSSSKSFGSWPSFSGFGVKKFHDGGWVKPFEGAVNQLRGVLRMQTGGKVPASAHPTAIPQGGPVGSSSSYNIDSVHVSMRGSDVSPGWVRRTLLPALTREVSAGRNSRARTRR
jgi:hypothetical protein